MRIYENLLLFRSFGQFLEIIIYFACLNRGGKK